MTKRLLTLHPRERRLLLGSMAIGGCWALTAGFVQPLWDRVRESRLSVETHVKKLGMLSHLVTQAQLIEQEYHRLIGYLDQRGTDQARGAFLNELEALSRTAGVTLNLKPRPIKEVDHLNRFEVEVDAEGSSEHVLAFLDALMRMPSLVTIERLRIAIQPSKARQLRASLLVQRILLRQ